MPQVHTADFRVFSQPVYLAACKSAFVAKCFSSRLIFLIKGYKNSPEVKLNFGFIIHIPVLNLAKDNSIITLTAP